MLWWIVKLKWNRKSSFNEFSIWPKIQPKVSKTLSEPAVALFVLQFDFWTAVQRIRSPIGLGYNCLLFVLTRWTFLIHQELINSSSLNWSRLYARLLLWQVFYQTKCLTLNGPLFEQTLFTPLGLVVKMNASQADGLRFECHPGLKIFVCKLWSAKGSSRGVFSTVQLFLFHQRLSFGFHAIKLRKIGPCGAQ